MGWLCSNGANAGRPDDRTDDRSPVRSMIVSMTAINTPSKTMENPNTKAVATCLHTRRTLQLETGASERTVRRWIKKAAVTGHAIDGVERFSDEQRELILSHQAKPKEDVVEAELIEPGAITLRQADGPTAAPLTRFNIEPVEIDLPTVDTSELTAQTAQLEQAAHQGADALAAYFGARFDVGLAKIAAAQDNLLKGIEAQALNGAAQSLANKQAQMGKPR